jgi:restriction endonuclease Mrr
MTTTAAAARIPAMAHVLVDGRKRAELTIAPRVGVHVALLVEVVKIDEDFFGDD